MDNFFELFYKNANGIYYFLSVLTIFYTTYAIIYKKIKNSKLLNCIKLITEVPETINQIKEYQSEILRELFSEIRLQNKIINAILDNLEIAQFISDSDGKCIKVNANWVSITGLPESEALGNNWLISVHPEDRNRVQEEWTRMVEDNAPFEEVFRYQNRITKIITTVKCSATDILNEKNERVFILGLSKVVNK